MIAEKIKEINIASNKITHKTEEQKINELLDFINELKKDIRHLTSLYENLESLLFSIQDDEPNEVIENIDILNEIITLTFSLIANYKESTIYSGIKTELIKLSLIVGTVKEIRNDVIYKYQTSKTKKHQAVNKKLAELL